MADCNLFDDAHGAVDLHGRLPDKSPGFARVRIGIGKPPGKAAGVDHVLKRPGKADRLELDVAVVEAADAVEMILAEGFSVSMNRYNTRSSEA